MAKKFGSYAVFSAVRHWFEKETEWYWDIKPATSGMELAMDRLYLDNRILLASDGSRLEKPVSRSEVMHREIALTFGGTNIVDEDGKLILEEGAPVAKVEEVLRQMPHQMVVEIWQAIGEANPKWGPVKDPNAPILGRNEMI